MNSDELQRLIAEQLPLAQTLHLKLEEVSPATARIFLKSEPTLLNHLGGLHAAALFAAAETSALALGYMLLPTTEVICATKGVELRFRKPVRGDVWAVAQPVPGAEATADELLARLTAEGKLEVPLHVTVADQAGERAAEGTITLMLRRL